MKDGSAVDEKFLGRFLDAVAEEKAKLGVEAKPDCPTCGKRN